MIKKKMSLRDEFKKLQEEFFALNKKIGEVFESYLEHEIKRGKIIDVASFSEEEIREHIKKRFYRFMPYSYHTLKVSQTAIDSQKTLITPGKEDMKVVDDFLDRNRIKKYPLFMYYAKYSKNYENKNRIDKRQCSKLRDTALNKLAYKVQDELLTPIIECHKGTDNSKSRLYRILKDIAVENNKCYEEFFEFYKIYQAERQKISREYEKDTDNSKSRLYRILKDIAVENNKCYEEFFEFYKIYQAERQKISREYEKDKKEKNRRLSFLNIYAIQREKELEEKYTTEELAYAIIKTECSSKFIIDIMFKNRRLSFLNIYAIQREKELEEKYTTEELAYAIIKTECSSKFIIDIMFDALEKAITSKTRECTIYKEDENGDINFLFKRYSKHTGVLAADGKTQDKNYKLKVKQVSQKARIQYTDKDKMADEVLIGVEEYKGDEQLILTNKDGEKIGFFYRDQDNLF